MSQASDEPPPSRRGRASNAATARRLVLATGAGAAIALALWHARPVLIWHLRLAPELRTSARADRLTVPSVEDFAEPPPGWARLDAAGLLLTAPIRPGQAAACRRCSELCVLELGRGRLTVLDSILPDTYESAIAQFAPSAEDISIFRPASANWRTLEALAGRVGIGNELPQTFRYRSEGSRGIVSRFESEGTERFVIYAYAPDGRGGRVVALSRTGSALLHQLLGSLEVGDRLGAASCSERGDGP